MGSLGELAQWLSFSVWLALTATGLWMSVLGRLPPLRFTTGRTWRPWTLRLVGLCLVALGLVTLYHYTVVGVAGIDPTGTLVALGILLAPLLFGRWRTNRRRGSPT